MVVRPIDKPLAFTLQWGFAELIEGLIVRHDQWLNPCSAYCAHYATLASLAVGVVTGVLFGVWFYGEAGLLPALVGGVMEGFLCFGFAFLTLHPSSVWWQLVLGVIWLVRYLRHRRKRSKRKKAILKMKALKAEGKADANDPWSA